MRIPVVISLLACTAMTACVFRGRGFAVQTRIAEEFMASASRLDSIAMLGSASRPVVQSMLDLARHDPELIRAASHGLRVEVGEIRADTAVIDFRIRDRTKSARFGVRFHRAQERWVIDVVSIRNMG